MLVRILKKLAHLMIAKIERTLGSPADHMRYIVDTSLGAFLDILLVRRFATRRAALPADAQHVARILATSAADCGSCTQVAVDAALRDGLAPEHARAVLDRRPEALPRELRDVFDFTQHVLDRTYGEGELRDALRARYGDLGLIDLAYAIASAQLFPTTKQVLGFATSCSKVEVRVDTARDTGRLLIGLPQSAQSAHSVGHARAHSSTVVQPAAAKHA